MKNLSEHFNPKNFVCQCGKCEGKFKISLTLVGILESIYSKFSKPVIVIEGFRCPENPHLFDSVKTDPHAQGKAVDIRVEDISLEELFNFVQKIPEISGIGFNPEQNFIHLEIGEPERKIWLGEGKERIEISDLQIEKYHLDILPTPSREKKLVQIKSLENDF